MSPDPKRAGGGAGERAGRTRGLPMSGESSEQPLRGHPSARGRRSPAGSLQDGRPEEQPGFGSLITV